MERPNIDAEMRTEKGKNAARRARRAGRVPAVLYGAGPETVALSMDPRQVLAALRSEFGRNTIFNLHLKNGASTPAMIVETQYEPIRSTLLHVDLKRIAMDKKLKVFVPVVITGEPKGVKLQGGTMEVVSRQVEVECLPTDIPDHITVAVEDLGLGDGIRLADLQAGLGDNVRLLGDSHAVICHVVSPKAEEVAPAAEAAAAAEPEVIKKGKGEAAEGAEAEKSEKKK